MKYIQSINTKGWSLALLLALSWTAPKAQNPQLQWAAMTNSAVHKNMQAMTVDSDGNTLVVIASFGAFNFAGSLIPHTSFLNISFGPTLIKLDPSGNILWYRSLRGPFQSSVNCDGIDTDEDNNIYVTYTGFSNLENSSAIGGLIVSSNNFSDYFIVKISPEGNGLWFKTADYTSIEYAGNSPTIKVLPDGCFYSSANFSGTVNLDGILLENVELSSGYILKSDVNGNALWAKKIASQGGYINWYRDMEVGNDGSLVITGEWFGETLQIDSMSITNDLAFTGNLDRFICKITAEGTVQWLVREHSQGSENPARLTVMPDGEVLAASYIEQDDLHVGDITLSGVGMALSRYTATGEVISATLLGDALGDFPEFNPPVITSIDDTAFIIAADFSSTTLNLGGLQVNNLGGMTGTSDIYIAKVNVNGEAAWIFTIGSEDSEHANFIASVDEDRFLIGGEFTGIGLNIEGTTLLPHTQYETEHFLASFSTVLNTRTAEALQQLLAYPNPFSESVQFDAEALQSFGNATLTVFNTSGVEVYRKQLKGHDTEQISLAHLPKGAYVARLSDGKRSLHTKIVKY